MAMFDDEPSNRRVLIRFSPTEFLHIGLAVLFLTPSFTFILADQNGVDVAAALARLQSPWQDYLASFIAVSSGFVLHELGHKVVAQRYGFWAEFRGQFSGLAMSLAFALGLGFLFAAPGAVMIWGRVSNRQNGIISIMGPGINFVIAALAFPFSFAVDADAFFPRTMEVVAVVNAILCLFNLLPILNLDGRKVLAWNKPIYFLSLFLALAFVATLLVTGKGL